MRVPRRTTILAGLGLGVAAAVSKGSPAHSAPTADPPNTISAAEAAHVQRLRQDLNAAAAGDTRFPLDETGRRIVTAQKLTHILKSPLVIGGDTALHAHGATFVADYPVEPRTWQALRTVYHSPTPTYPDTFETVRSTVSATLLINHVPSKDTAAYTAPGNIRVEGGIWDPTAYFLRNATGEDRQRGTAAPPMNALTFQHTHHVEVVGVTVRNVKWWHAVEFNGVLTATVRDSRFEGYIENPTSGLWTGDAVQVDLPYSPALWAGAADEVPACDIRIRDNWCGRSADFPPWAKLGISHSSKPGKVYQHVWVERNVCENLIWDAIAPGNVEKLVIRENTIINCRGGIYVVPHLNPLTTVDVIGNTVSVAMDANNRPAIGLIGRSATEDIKDAAVYGNIVSSGVFRYTFTTFRREPQRQ